MSRGTTYFGLLANLRHEEILHEARLRQRPTDPIRPRRNGGIGAALLRALRITRR